MSSALARSLQYMQVRKEKKGCLTGGEDDDDGGRKFFFFSLVH